MALAIEYCVIGFTESIAFYILHNFFVVESIHTYSWRNIQFDEKVSSLYTVICIHYLVFMMER